MLDLSPAKLLIVFIVVVVLLGPNRLPEVARQLGAGWQRLRDFHQRVDQEIRKSIPDLPSSQDLARLARSPVSLLNELVPMPSVDPLTVDRDAPKADPSAPEGPSAPSTAAGQTARDTPGAGAMWPVLPSDDPGMN